MQQQADSSRQTGRNLLRRPPPSQLCDARLDVVHHADELVLGVIVLQQAMSPGTHGHSLVTTSSRFSSVRPTATHAAASAMLAPATAPPASFFAPSASSFARSYSSSNSCTSRLLSA